MAAAMSPRAASRLMPSTGSRVRPPVSVADPPHEAGGSQRQDSENEHEQQALQRAGVEPAGQRASQREQPVQQAVVQPLRLQPVRVAVVKREQGPAPEVNQPTAPEGDDAHPQRRTKAVPDRQIVFRRRFLQDAGGRHRENGLHGQGWQDTHQQADGRQHLHRNLHPARRLVRGFGQIDRLAVEEHVVNEAQRIGHGEDASQRHRRRQQPAEAQLRAGADRFGEEHLLGQESVQQRHAGHGGRRHHGERAGIGHEFPQAVDAAHVAAAGLVVDDAGRHEQRGFEGRVVDDVKHPGHGGERRADAEQQGDQPQVTEGGISQQALEIVLEQGDERAQQQGDQSHAADQPGPFGRAGQGRKQPRQQEHPRFHHGGRMQVGRHRRRRRHGVGQPEMERKLG